MAGLLACPRCRSGLAIGAEALRCGDCGTRYPFHQDIALLAVGGTSETWGEPQAAAQSAAYQAEYQRVENAATYNLAYRDKLLKRSSTRREFELIARHLARVGRSQVILDLPCGGGRLTPAFAASADLVIEADIALGQLLYGRQASSVETPRAWMTASAFHIPLRDQAVDGAISVRLSHHLPTEAERERHLAELLRVSRRFVIMTFFDQHSLKNRLRRLRRPWDRQPPKMTMTVSRVADIARARGARLVDAPPLSRIGSGHRYALIVRDGASA
ncbi:MAG TPA: methyltransferase domain-containing protein [Steroidobacteraceae bacterium]|nr:methyltransferase domain-containing protein [Steroidobacteraceae bacterium]